MNDSVHLKYLAIGPGDLAWGTAINSVGYQEVAPGEAYPPGDHPSRYLFSTRRGRILDEYQLIYITRGSGHFKSAHLPHPVDVRPGTVFLLFPGEWHTYMPDPSTGWKEYWIGFNGSQMDSWVEGGFFSPSRPIWQAGLHNGIVSLYQDAIETATGQGSGFQQRLGGIVAHLLSLARYYDRKETFSEISDQIARAKIIIDENAGTITPEELASKLCIGYSKFRKSFKEYTGFPPAKYIQQVRIGKIKEALTNSTRPVKQIAYEMGYDNDDYFFTVFRRLTGMTPQQYRNLTRGPKENKK